VKATPPLRYDGSLVEAGLEGVDPATHAPAAYRSTSHPPTPPGRAWAPLPVATPLAVPADVPGLHAWCAEVSSILGGELYGRPELAEDLGALGVPLSPRSLASLLRSGGELSGPLLSGLARLRVFLLMAGQRPRT
jgi:hypothetical protein